MSTGNVRNLSPAFWQTLWSVATELGASPHVLGLILYEESGIDPTAKNADGCVGICQFCGTTYTTFVKLPKDQYLALAAEKQLDPYVLAYWRTAPAAALATARDLFWHSLTPVSWVPNASPSTVVNDPAKYAKTFGGDLAKGTAYAATVAKENPAVASDGIITAGQIDAYLSSVAGSPGWQLALDYLAQYAPGGATPTERA
jgi:hypothetical protein